MNSQHIGIGMTSQRTRERLVQRLREEGIRDERVLDVIRHLPRHIFIDEALSSRAYEDTALPIGAGQTISQPYIVARMSEALLEGEPPKRVLEVGTGSGYQCAVLANLVEKVYSVERLASLLNRARSRIQELGLRNVMLRHGDGFQGWPEMAPFDAIIVTAAPAEVPQALLNQLADGGRLVIPVGGRGAQQLYRITRNGDVCHQELLDLVSFVPMLDGIRE